MGSSYLPLHHRASHVPKEDVRREGSEGGGLAPENREGALQHDRRAQDSRHVVFWIPGSYLVQVLFLCPMRSGLNCVPPNSRVEVLTLSTSGRGCSLRESIWTGDEGKMRSCG